MAIRSGVEMTTVVTDIIKILLVSVCMIYVVCTVIDQVRIWAAEKPFF